MLYQNDDYGKDYFNGIKDGLGKEAGRLVKVVTYELTDPTVDSQIIELKNSGANVFYNVSISKFAAQAMRKAADLGWKPVQYMNNVAASARHDHEARWLRQRAGRAHRGLAEGPHRSSVGQRSRT